MSFAPDITANVEDGCDAPLMHVKPSLHTPAWSARERSFVALAPWNGPDVNAQNRKLERAPIATIRPLLQQWQPGVAARLFLIGRIAAATRLFCPELVRAYCFYGAPGREIFGSTGFL